MSNTLLLDQATWDLTVDAVANIAMASDPYSIAQDVATACRTFLGEEWYNTSVGVPYLQRILGKIVPAPFIKAQLVQAALTVPHVVAAKVIFTSFVRRSLAGQIQITDDRNNVSLVAFSQVQGTAPWYVSAASVEASS